MLKSPLKAARNAGISPVVLIKEPEAAAMYTLHYLKHQGLDVWNSSY
jgi:molecular chaperone DnaK (HSP70)